MLWGDMFSNCANYILTGALNSDDILCWDRRKMTIKVASINIGGGNSSNNSNNSNNNGYCNDNEYINSRNSCVSQSFERNMLVKQVVTFDIDRESSKYIVSGGHNGYANVYRYDDMLLSNQETNHKPICRIEHCCRAVNNAKLNPRYPYLATTTGERVDRYVYPGMSTKRAKQIVQAEDKQTQKGNKFKKHPDKKTNQNQSDEESDSDIDRDLANYVSVKNVNDVYVWNLSNRELVVDRHTL